MPRPPLAALPTAVVAALTLVVGFAVGQLTGVRPLAAVVLIAGGAWCAWRAVPTAGWWRVAAVVLVAVLAFVGSHLAAPTVGAWPAVIAAALLLGGAAWLLVDRAAGRAGSDRSADGPTMGAEGAAVAPARRRP